MTIRNKLYLGFLCSAICVAIVGAFSIHSLAVTAGALRTTINTTLREVKETTLGAETVVTIDTKTDRFVEAVESQRSAEAATLKNEIASHFETLSGAIADLRDESHEALAAAGSEDEGRQEKDHLARINEIDNARVTLLQNWDAIGAELKTTGKLNKELVHRNDVENDWLVSRTLALQDSARSEISDTLNETAKSVRLQWLIVVIVGAMAVALTGTIAVVTAAPLGRRLEEVRAKADRLGGGDLAARIINEGDDEISDLAETFNQMAEGLAGSREQLIHSAERAEAANQAKSAFLANMSHEIRTPMTAVMGYAERLLEHRQNFGEDGEALQVIHRSGKHLLDLINDILDISKIEANKMTVERVDTDLPRIATEVVSLLRPRAVAQGLTLRLTFGDPLPHIIQSDPLRLKQVMMNVVGNALKFTDRGEVRLHVACEPSENSSVVAIEVTDTGIGISREQLASLFQPFTQADSSTTRRFGGTGLGLTISKRLAELLGGGLTVESVPRVGSSFRITIDGGPLAGVEMLHGLSESVAVSRPVEVEGADRIALQCHILLVEDGADNQRLISLHLKEAGATVSIARNGRVALDMVQREPFNLILMDMQMPEMDGYAATRELRARGCKLPVIALTAHAMSDDRTKCLEAGCDEYVQKPINRKLLLTTIARMLNRPGNVTPPVAERTRPGQPTTDTTPLQLRSSLAGEPQYHDLIREYIDGLPAQVERIEAALRENNTEALRRELHDVRGTAGGLGFQPLTDMAADLGAHAKTAAALAEIEAKVRRLINTIQNIEGFGQQRGSEAEVTSGQP